jgi:Flp pilus assembly protein TadG
MNWLSRSTYKRSVSSNVVCENVSAQLLAKMFNFLPQLLRRLVHEEAGAVTVVAGLSLIPMIAGVGLSVDYARITAAQTKIRAALDSALLAGALQSNSSRDSVATQAFDAQKPNGFGIVDQPSFATSADNLTYSGSVTATIDNHIMQLFGFATTAVSIQATAAMPVYDQSCILGLAKGLNVGDDALTFNGGSNLDLKGCTLQSNASMVCNGTIAADKSMAVGSVSKCANSKSDSLPVPDIYATIASNITKQCGVSAFNNLTWDSTSMPSSPKMFTITSSDRVEYHVCGSLTLEGSGPLFQTSDTRDSIIVIENGSLLVAADAAVVATRTAFVMTGRVGSHELSFPQGSGHSAGLTISPPRDSSDPWKGIALYQDPSLTTDVDMSWGPGSSISADGVLYFPNAALTMSGSGNSNNSNCTKLVVNTLRANGSYDFSQSESGCAYINMKQYAAPARLIY